MPNDGLIHGLRIYTRYDCVGSCIIQSTQVEMTTQRRNLEHLFTNDSTRHFTVMTIAYDVRRIIISGNSFSWRFSYNRKILNLSE